MAEPLDIALIQTRTPATSATGLDHVAPLIRQAAGEGASLILTPEATNRVERRREGRATLMAEADDAAGTVARPVFACAPRPRARRHGHPGGQRDGAIPPTSSHRLYASMTFRATIKLH